MATEADVKVAIDRGGTFCDVVMQVGMGKPTVFKFLSEDPGNYVDAPTEAIRRVLEMVEHGKIPPTEKLNASRIGKARLHRITPCRP